MTLTTTGPHLWGVIILISYITKLLQCEIYSTWWSTPYCCKMLIINTHICSWLPSHRSWKSPTWFTKPTYLITIIWWKYNLNPEYFAPGYFKISDWSVQILRASRMFSMWLGTAMEQMEHVYAVKWCWLKFIVLVVQTLVPPLLDFAFLKTFWLSNGPT